MSYIEKYTKTIVDTVVLQCGEDVQSIYLFGSAVYEQEVDGVSDIDIIVIVRNETTDRKIELYESILKDELMKAIMIPCNVGLYRSKAILSINAYQYHMRKRGLPSAKFSLLNLKYNSKLLYGKDIRDNISVKFTARAINSWAKIAPSYHLSQARIYIGMDTARADGEICKAILQIGRYIAWKISSNPTANYEEVVALLQRKSNPFFGLASWALSQRKNGYSAHESEINEKIIHVDKWLKTFGLYPGTSITNIWILNRQKRIICKLCKKQIRNLKHHGRKCVLCGELYCGSLKARYCSNKCKFKARYEKLKKPNVIKWKCVEGHRNTSYVPNDFRLDIHGNYLSKCHQCDNVKYLTSKELLKYADEASTKQITGSSVKIIKTCFSVLPKPESARCPKCTTAVPEDYLIYLQSGRKLKCNKCGAVFRWSSAVSLLNGFYLNETRTNLKKRTELYVDEGCKRLGLDNDIKTCTLKLINKPKWFGRRAVVAGAIYIACLLRGNTISQRQISNALNVSDAALRLAYHKLVRENRTTKKNNSSQILSSLNKQVTDKIL